MENIELDQLVYTYPYYDVENFQTLISSKEEFREIMALVKEPVPERGQLFRHQKFLKRFLTQYDTQFVIWSAGLGKACGSISVAEHYKALAGVLETMRKSSEISATHLNPPYKRAYVLVKGQTLIDEFKFQILCKCTDGDYITEQIKNSKTETSRKNNVTRSISSFYEIKTYGAFAKELLELTDEQLRINYSNSIFIVDEVHNVNDDKAGGSLRKHPKSGVEYYVRSKRDKKSGEIKEVIVENRLIYDQLWRVFHKVTPRKAIIMSATPMINDPKELSARMNLLLPEDRQIPNDINFKTVKLETLEPYFRGLISYVRALDTGAIPVYQGEIIDATYPITDLQREAEAETKEMIKKEEVADIEEEDEEEIEPEEISEEPEPEEEISEAVTPQIEDSANNSDLNLLKKLRNTKNKNGVKAQMVVYMSEMESKQASVYERAVNDPESLRPDSKNPGAFSDLERQTANFVFPDNTTGSVGFRKYVTRDQGRFVATPEFYEWISDFEKLKSLSIKFAEIIRLCKEDPGNCWCYSNFIRGSGAIVLGLCMEAQGFENFTENSSVFSTTGSSGLAPICAGKSLDDVSGERFVRIPKALRYALLTSETTGPESAALLELFNSYENRHGEYIKAVVGSPVTRDGLNLANVLQIHLLGPGWNQASAYQAESRAIRSTSHVDLIEEERERLRQEGADPATIANASITINVYRHAAIDDQSGTSIDLQMYQLSEIKDREIKRIMRMMKQCAVDCQINYNRNVRVSDISKDYSADCDYDICKYKCVDPIPDWTDYDSYDVLYSQDVIEAAKLEIIDIFRLIFNLPYSDLYNELGGYRRKFVDLAVAQLVEGKVPIFDRYGNLSYLREDRGTLFLTKDYPLNIFEREGSVAISEYTSMLLGISTMTLTEYNGLVQRGAEKNILDVVKNNFDEKVETLTLENRVLLLEKALYEYYVMDNKSDIVEQVINYFREYIYLLYEPTNALKISEEAYKKRNQGRGRKPLPGTKFKLKDKEEEVERTFAVKQKKSPPVYFHNLFSSGRSATSYAITSKSRKTEGKIRILKPDEKVGWRDAEPFEDPVYNAYIRYKIKEKTETRPEIHGTLLEDKKFRIVDKSVEDKKLAKKDVRNQSRGRVCVTWNIYELYNVLWKLKFNPFNIDIKYSEAQLREIFAKRGDVDAEDFTEEQLRFYYAWISSGANKNKICQLLQGYFEEQGMLY